MANNDLTKTALVAVVSALSLTAGKAATPLTAGMLVTTDATAQQAQLCPQGLGYPSEASWAGRPALLPQSATGGQPLITQYRNGVLIASYTTFANQPSCTLAGDGTDYLNPAAPSASGCGPFTR